MKILKVDNPNVFARHVSAPEIHPLISVIHFDEIAPIPHSMNNYGVYGLFIQREFPKSLVYGTKTIQASGSSIIAVAPGQLGGSKEGGNGIALSGWAVLWSPELLEDSSLEKQMKDYEFFSYFFSDSLQIDPAEWQAITQLASQLRSELQQHEDGAPLRSIVQSYLHLILEYCKRAYLRQSANRNDGDNDILKRFHTLLEKYYRDEKQKIHGVPSVAYCARELAYSPRYFGDLVHKATGGSAIGYIHSFVINQSKNFLMKGLSIGETAQLLGFSYPHHFTRLFKSVTGLTPSEFAKS